MPVSARILHGLQSGHIRIGTFSSVATHWLPYILQAFSRDDPGIDYELLLSDYCEVEGWLASGQVDCGFVRLPTRPEFATIFLQPDDLAAVLPAEHPLAAGETCSVQALGTELFILLDKAGNHETSEALARCGVTPDVRFTTWDDYAIMAMVECGLGVSLLPELILRRVPYRIAIRRLDTPLYRDIALALHGRAHISAATRQFLRYLDRRNAPEAPDGCTGFDNQA